MKHQYDWSKLDAGWSVNGYTLRYSTEGELLYEIPVSKLESIAELDCGRHHPDSPLAQLAKCRVVDNTPLFEAMDKMATEAESATQYNWNKLEGTGWREGNGAYITNGKFNYWYTLLGRARLEAFDKFYPDDAVAACNSAAAAVEQCCRDWRDEVMEACRGTGMSPVLSTRRTIYTIGNALNVDDQRRMRVLSTSMLDCAKLLALSIVIERLKKRGWRES